MSGVKSVIIDNCAWNILYKNSVNLSESVSEGFRIEVSAFGDIEIPDTQEPELAKYIRAALTNFGKVQKDFGFASINPNHPVDPRIGGFNQGAWVSQKRFDYLNAQPKTIGGTSGQKKTGSGLLKNETDVDYAARSFECPVVTDNIKDFRFAIQRGGKVIDISKWNPVSQTFWKFLVVEGV